MYFTTNGRITRSQYAIALLVFAVLGAIISGALVLSQTMYYPESLLWGAGIAFFFFMFPVIRRLHDTNSSGVCILLALVPFVNALLGLYCLLAPGTKGENRYGPDPRNRRARYNAKRIPDEHYGAASRELRNNTACEGLLARCMSDAEGDENKAHALYLKRRALEIYKSQ